MSSMHSIGEQLHAARLQHGISLEDIASATRISLRFLREIEQGIEPNVPQTYTRAFIKAFAGQVHLNSPELLQQYASVHSAVLPKNPPDTPVPKPSDDPVMVPRGAAGKKQGQRQLKPLLTLVAILLAGLIVFVLWLRNDRGARSVEEISFNDVVKEQEAKKADVRPPQDTTAIPPVVKREPAVADSLDLEAVAGANVWVHITIDGRSPKEYMMTKFSHLHWKAKSSFLVSVGNASAIALALNGQKVAVPARDTLPARNIALSHETLQKLQRIAPKQGVQ